MTGGELPAPASPGAATHRVAAPAAVRTDLVGWLGQRPVLAAVLGAACISSSAVLVTLAGAGPATTALYRCVLALPVLVPVAVIERRRTGPRPLAVRLRAAVAGLFLAVDLVLWNHAIADVGAGVATVLANLQVVFVVLIVWLLLRERPPRHYLVVLPVVLAGVVLVSGLAGHHRAGLHPAAGIAFGAGTSAAYACFLLILRGNGRRGAQSQVAGQVADSTVGAAIGSAVLGVIFGGLQLRIPAASLGWLLLLALLSQTLGWLLIVTSLPRLPAAVSSLLLLLQPAGAMVLAYLVLGEQPTLAQVGGAFLVCLGVLVVARNAGRTSAPSASFAAGEPQACTQNST